MTAFSVLGTGPTTVGTAVTGDAGTSANVVSMGTTSNAALKRKHLVRPWVS